MTEVQVLSFVWMLQNLFICFLSFFSGVVIFYVLIPDTAFRTIPNAKSHCRVAVSNIAAKYFLLQV
jgi:hypothetical protein